MKRTTPLYLIILALAFGVGVLSPAQAATVTHSATVALQSTGWTNNLSFPQFNPAAGTLLSVTIMVRDSLVATFRVENMSTSSGNTVRDSSKATVQVLRPDNSVMLSAISAKEQTATLPVYDGTLDFGGLSGRTYPNLDAVAVNSSVFTAPADLALFTGAGNITLPCKAIGWSYVSDTAGNVVHSVQTKAGAGVVVAYAYVATTPSGAPTWGALRRLYR